MKHKCKMLIPTWMIRGGVALAITHILMHEVPTLLFVFFGPEILTTLNLGG